MFLHGGRKFHVVCHIFAALGFISPNSQTHLIWAKSNVYVCQSSCCSLYCFTPNFCTHGVCSMICHPFFEHKIPIVARNKSLFVFISLHSEASEACDSGGRLRHAMQIHKMETWNIFPIFVTNHEHRQLLFRPIQHCLIFSWVNSTVFVQQNDFNTGCFCNLCDNWTQQVTGLADISPNERIWVWLGCPGVLRTT